MFVASRAGNYMAWRKRAGPAAVIFCVVYNLLVFGVEDTCVCVYASG